VLTPERQRSIDGQAWRGPAAGGVDLEVDVLGFSSQPRWPRRCFAAKDRQE
jgi:hypothetical protein